MKIHPKRLAALASVLAANGCAVEIASPDEIGPEEGASEALTSGTAPTQPHNPVPASMTMPNLNNSTTCVGGSSLTTCLGERGPSPNFELFDASGQRIQTGSSGYMNATGQTFTICGRDRGIIVVCQSVAPADPCKPAMIPGFPPNSPTSINSGFTCSAGLPKDDGTTMQCRTITLGANEVCKILNDNNDDGTCPPYSCVAAGQPLGSAAFQCCTGLSRCVGSTDYCRDLQSDNSNCGACGNVCPSGQQCYMGVCSI